jgi:hypothetical protein
MTTFRKALLAIIGALLLCGAAGAQMPANIDNGNALACRNKGDLESALDTLFKGEQAWLAAVATLAATGACISLNRGTPITVLEITTHSKGGPFNIARIRRAGDRNELYINAMYAKF